MCHIGITACILRAHPSLSNPSKFHESAVSELYNQNRVPERYYLFILRKEKVHFLLPYDFGFAEIYDRFLVLSVSTFCA